MASQLFVGNRMLTLPHRSLPRNSARHNVNRKAISKGLARPVHTGRNHSHSLNPEQQKI